MLVLNKEARLRGPFTHLGLSFLRAPRAVTEGFYTVPGECCCACRGGGEGVIARAPAFT